MIYTIEVRGKNTGIQKSWSVTHHRVGVLAIRNQY